MLYLSDQSVANEFCRHMEVGFRALPRTRLPDALVLLHGFHDSLLLSDGARQRLFAENIFLLLARLDRYESVPMVGDRDHHRVNILAREHLAIIVIRFAVLVVVVLVDCIDGLLQRTLVEIAGGHNLAILFGHQHAGIVRTLHAPADDADNDALRGSNTLVASEGAGRNECGRSDGRSGRGKEVTPRYSRI